MNDFALLPISAVLELIGKGRSSAYSDIREGLLTKPVPAGPQAVRWPAGEIRQIVQARIAGKSSDDIRALVKTLHEARKTAA